MRVTWKEVLALGVVGTAAWFFILAPDPDKKESKEEAAADLLAKTNKSQYAFSQDFWSKMLKQEGYTSAESYLTKIGVSITQVQNFAASLYDSKGTFDDDEDNVYSIYRMMKNITVCSIVSFIFNNLYNRDLYTYLSDFLNVKELTRVLEIVNEKNYL